MGYEFIPRNKEAEDFYGNISLVDIFCSAMEDAGVSTDIIKKFTYNQGDYVKKRETLEIANKLQVFLAENPAPVFREGGLTKRLRIFTEVTGLDGDDSIVRADQADILQDIEDFIRFCRVSGGFKVW